MAQTSRVIERFKEKGTELRARFAPSPTGYLHVGGARSALYNWLVVEQARSAGVKSSFLLRIEDTNTERSDPQYTQAIFDALSWLGLTWDGEPLYQSKRRKRYEEAAHSLEERGLAYWCECTREEIRQRTRTGAYDRRCASRGLTRAPGRVLRFRVPEGPAVCFNDEIHGSLSFERQSIEDFAMFKSNGDPLFILANVVDDLDMGVNCVIRGEDHLANTPKYVLLWQALSSKDLPIFAHVPLILDQQRRKLSKRHHKVGVEEYREAGYLPEGLLNYLALLGWGPKDGKEVLEMSELIEKFRLEDVGKSPAIFDEKKLDAINAEHLRELSDSEFWQCLLPFLKEELGFGPGKEIDPRPVLSLASHVKARAHTLREAARLTVFLYEAPSPEKHPDLEALMRDKDRLEVLRHLAQKLLSQSNWEGAVLHLAAKEAAEDLQLSLSKAQEPVRLAVTGSKVGLPLFDSLAVIGKEEFKRRVSLLFEAT